VEPEQRERLLSVYAVEREDDHSALLLGFSMATAAFTYMIAATVYVFNLHGDCAKLSVNRSQLLCENLAILQFLAPAIPVAVVGYMALNTAAARMRSVHLQRLEEALGEQLATDSGDNPARAPGFHTDAGIVWRPDSPWKEDWPVHLMFTAISFIVYGIINGGVVVFTWVVLNVGGWTGDQANVGRIEKKTVAIVYGIILVVEIAGFVVPVFHPRFKFRKSPKEPPKNLPPRRRRGILYYLFSAGS
jgi:hypothetical protein